MTRILFVLVLLFGVSSSFAQREIIDRVVAMVGGEIVLLSEVEEQKALLEAQQGELPEDVRCRILDNVLGQKLLVNQAKLDSVLVADEEVEAQLDARIQQILAYMNDDIQQFEDYYGQTVNEVKEQFREDLRSQLLAERMRGQIIAGITVTPREVKNFFDQIPIDSLPYFNSEVEIGEIVMKPEVNEEERQKAITTLEELRRSIMEDGLDFAEVAQKNSDDFGSARIGGDLGWTRRGKFVPEFEAAAYNLEVDEISDVVESQFGFHLIQLVGRRGNSIRARHILIKPEITDADLEKTREKLDSVRQLILDDSLSFSIAVKRYGDKDVQSYNNDGRAVNPKTGNTFFEIADLEPDIYFAIDTLKIGGICEPFAFQSPFTGERMFRIVQLQSRTDPHVASLKQDYSKIRTAAADQKRSEYVGNWLQDRVESTYIEIDPMFQDCEMIKKWLKDR
jgi:peptidyl-prolyl cis-trans isomerase SurA